MAAAPRVMAAAACGRIACPGTDWAAAWSEARATAAVYCISVIAAVALLIVIKFRMRSVPFLLGHVCPRRMCVLLLRQRLRVLVRV